MVVGKISSSMLIDDGGIYSGMRIDGRFDRGEPDGELEFKAADCPNGRFLQDAAVSRQGGRSDRCGSVERDLSFII